MSAPNDAATKRALFVSAYESLIFQGPRSASFSNSVLIILPDAAADLSLPRSMPAGRVGSGKAHPSEFLILMQLLNLTRVAPRSAFPRRLRPRFWSALCGRSGKLYCTLLNSDET
jgi:hypothetical protein